MPGNRQAGDTGIREDIDMHIKIDMIGDISELTALLHEIPSLKKINLLKRKIRRI